MWVKNESISVFAAAWILTGCATQAPLEIRQPPLEDLSIIQVRDDIERHKGARVRWGGWIADVSNKEEETWLEVVAGPLDSRGRPRYDDRTMGRFIARIPGFLDPQIYAGGRAVTVYGEVESRVVRKIDEHPYTYPLVRTLSYQLWEEHRGRRYAYPYYRPRVHFGFHHGFRHGHHFGFGFHHYHRFRHHW